MAQSITSGGNMPAKTFASGTRSYGRIRLAVRWSRIFLDL